MSSIIKMDKNPEYLITLVNGQEMEITLKEYKKIQKDLMSGTLAAVKKGTITIPLHSIFCMMEKSKGEINGH